MYKRFAVEIYCRLVLKSSKGLYPFIKIKKGTKKMSSKDFPPRPHL